MPTLVLASQSPRRRALLQQLGLNPVVAPAHINEIPHSHESALHLVERLAIGKAQVVSAEQTRAHPRSTSNIIIAADTVVQLDGDILGKPVDEADGLRMLHSLSGRTHQVITGVCVVSGSEQRVRVVQTQVTMGEISSMDALRYWQSGEPAGKAGAYAIQGLGAAFVQDVTGSYSNVVGLPLYDTVQMLAELDFDVFKVRSANEN
ncbi:MAG: Maf family protein [Gammaproteobacteria bacterium]|nr:Maf family protein [Gammaproteobacteria bacterium]